MPAESVGPSRVVATAGRAARPPVAGRPVPVWLTLAGIVLLSLNLRAAVAGLPPLVPAISTDLALSRSTAGLLTSLPVLCFGVLAPVAALVARRVGTEATLLLAMAAIALGSLVRAVDQVAWVVAGTLVIGAGMTAGNVLVPSVVKQDFEHRLGLATGLYMAALTGGAALAAAVSAPLADTAGLGWRGSLLVWGGVAALSAAVWAPQLRRRHAAPAVRVGGGGVLRSPITWALVVFMGMQAWIFYAMLAWLPALLQDAGVSTAGSGWALAVFNLLGIATAIVTPALADRVRDQRVIALVTCGVWGAGLVGLLLAPGAYLVWAVLTGLAQGAGISLALTLLVLRARTPESARDLSGTVQAGGYLLASTGPLLVGVLRDASDGWDVPLIALCGASVLMALAALEACRDRQL